jgi:hypothetical protein
MGLARKGRRGGTGEKERGGKELRGETKRGRDT